MSCKSTFKRVGLTRTLGATNATRLLSQLRKLLAKKGQGCESLEAGRRLARINAQRGGVGI